MDALTESLWAEAEQHLREFERLAWRTVEEAWLAGDALMRIKEQLPHGVWTPALEERSIAPASARRFIQLRKQYPPPLVGPAYIEARQHWSDGVHLSH